MKTRKLCELAILLAISLVIFIIELYIPPVVPIPGIKMGLSNIITLILVARYKKSEVLTVVISRVILSAVFTGTMLSFFYSASAGIVSAIIMICLYKVFGDELLWVVSVFGAIFHNLTQIAVASVMLGSSSVIVYIAPLLLSAIITGAFTGIAARTALCRIGGINEKN